MSEQQSEISKNQLDMLMAEYKESASAFFKGVDIGITYTRSFLYLNGILLGVIGLGEKFPALASIPAQHLPILHIVVGIFGAGLAIMLASLIRYYRKQLENCAEICSAIERLNELKVKAREKTFFSELHKINMQKRFMTPTRAGLIIPLIFLIAWIAFLSWQIFERLKLHI